MKFLDQCFTSGRMTRKPGRAYGYYNGAWVEAVYETGTNSSRPLLKIAFSQITPEAKSAVIDAVGEDPILKKYATIKRWNEHSVIFDFKVDLIAKNNARNVMLAADTVITILGRFGISSGCEVCGNPDSVEFFDIKSAYGVRTVAPLCPACAQAAYQQTVAEAENARTENSNFFMGLIGALIGCLIGFVIDYMLGINGKMSFYTGVIMATSVFVLFNKMAKATDIKGACICFCLGFAALWFAYRFSTAAYLSKLLDKRGITYSTIDIFKNMSSINTAAGITVEYYKWLVLDMLSYVVTAIFLFYSAVQTRMGKFKFDKA